MSTPKSIKKRYNKMSWKEYCAQYFSVSVCVQILLHIVHIEHLPHIVHKVHIYLHLVIWAFLDEPMTCALASSSLFIAGGLKIAQKRRLDFHLMNTENQLLRHNSLSANIFSTLNAGPSCCKNNLINTSREARWLNASKHLWNVPMCLFVLHAEISTIV